MVEFDHFKSQDGLPRKHTRLCQRLTTQFQLRSRNIHSTSWMYPQGTNPFRTNPEGMYPLCGLIHNVDVSRRDKSFQDQSRRDVSAMRTYPQCGCIPKGFKFKQRNSKILNNPPFNYGEFAVVNLKIAIKLGSHRLLLQFKKQRDLKKLISTHQYEIVNDWINFVILNNRVERKIITQRIK